MFNKADYQNYQSTYDIYVFFLALVFFLRLRLYLLVLVRNISRCIHTFADNAVTYCCMPTVFDILMTKTVQIMSLYYNKVWFCVGIFLLLNLYLELSLLIMICIFLTLVFNTTACYLVSSWRIAQKVVNLIKRIRNTT